MVSPGSRSEDRYLKPGLYAEAGIPYYWRVERGENDLPEVYEFWLDRESGVYAPAPRRLLPRGGAEGRGAVPGRDRPQSAARSLRYPRMQLGPASSPKDAGPS
nr:Uma2 family endonuclease [Kitasatospora sp. MAA4]